VPGRDHDEQYAEPEPDQLDESALLRAEAVDQDLHLDMRVGALRLCQSEKHDRHEQISADLGHPGGRRIEDVAGDHLVADDDRQTVILYD
jgi:hypothetical protein